MNHRPALSAAGLSAGLALVVPGAASSPALAAPGARGPAPAAVAATAGSAGLIGGSAVAGGCIVTIEQPVLQIPGSSGVNANNDPINNIDPNGTGNIAEASRSAGMLESYPSIETWQ